MSSSAPVNMPGTTSPGTIGIALVQLSLAGGGGTTHSATSYANPSKSPGPGGDDEQVLKLDPVTIFSQSTIAPSEQKVQLLQRVPFTSTRHELHSPMSVQSISSTAMSS